MADDHHSHSASGFTDTLLSSGLLVDKYYTPLICFVGVLGNFLSLAVFCLDSKYRSQPSSYYLSTLALSDTGFLLSLLLVWLEGVLGGVIISPVMCPLVMYLGQVTCFTSIYLMVGFTIERFVAVHYPFAKQRICTRSKAVKTISGVVVTALILFSYVWIIAQVVEINKRPEDLGLSNVHGVNHSDGYFNETNLTPEGSPSVFSREFIDGINEADLMNDPVSQRNGNVGEDMARFEQSSGESNRTETPALELLTRDASPNLRCSVPSQYFKVSEFANYADMGVTLVVPFILIAYFNLRISISVWKLMDKRQQMVASPLLPVSKSVELVASETNQRRNKPLTRVLSNNHLHPYFHANSGKTVENRVEESRESIANLRSKSKQDVASSVASSLNEIEQEEMQQLNTRVEDLSFAPATGEQMNRTLPKSRLVKPAERKTDREHASSAEVRVTKTLLLVSTVFLGLNLPLHLIRCAQFLQSLTGREGGKELLRALQPWANLLFNTNFAVNFLLYCASGRNFRKSLTHVGNRLCNKSSQQQNIVSKSFPPSPCVKRRTEMSRGKSNANENISTFSSSKVNTKTTFL